MSKAGKTTPSHLVAPPGIQVNPSMVHKGVLGVYCTVPIAEGQLFGPFAGEVILEGDDEEVDYRFAWEVYDLKTNKLLHIINATKPKSGNWMRYVNCARFFEEQNIVSIQKGCEIFYKAIRPISAGEELLTWFAPLSGQSKRQGKRKPAVPDDSGVKEMKKTKRKSKSPENVDDKMKSLLLYEYLTKDEKQNKSKLDKKLKITTETDNNELTEETDSTNKSQNHTASKSGSQLNTSDDDIASKSKAAAHNWLTPDMKLHTEHSADKVYQFVLREDHKAKTKTGGIMYACDICGAPYNRMFSLKRHIVRQHINAKYLSLADITNCMVNVVQQERSVQAKFDSKRIRKCKSDLKPICDLSMPGLYRCFVCSELFDFTEDLREHECESMKQSKTKLHRCPVCRIKFALKVDLTRHKLVHTEGIETPFSCKICGKSFMSSSSLKKHIQFHSGNNFSCRLCPERFSSVMELRQHVSSKHLHVSSKQSNTLKQTLMKSKQKFKVHNKVKVAEEMNSKDIADNVILVKSDSEGVEVTKVKQKRNRKFKKPHKKSVSDDLPFICGVCGKAFPNGGRLKMHMSYHMDRVYTCRFCEIKHLKLAHYRKHLQDVHPESLQNGILIRNGKDDTVSTRITRNRSLSLSEKRKSVSENEKPNEDTSVHEHPENSVISQAFDPKDDVEDPVEELWEGEIKSPRTGKQSRFNFACTVCKKKFNCYVNMCRHRRLAHRSHKYGHPTLIRQREAAKLRDTVIVSDYIPIPPELSYANVAENIATNLNCFLDGGQEAITSCQKYIKPHSTETVVTSRTEIPVTWTRFNFPSSFQPWEGVVGYDIDEELLKVYDDLDIDKSVESRNIRRRCRAANNGESDVKNEMDRCGTECNSDDITNKQEVESCLDAKFCSDNMDKQNVKGASDNIMDTIPDTKFSSDCVMNKQKVESSDDTRCASDNITAKQKVDTTSHTKCSMNKKEFESSDAGDHMNKAIKNGNIVNNEVVETCVDINRDNDNMNKGFESSRTEFSGDDITCSSDNIMNTLSDTKCGGNINKADGSSDTTCNNDNILIKQEVENICETFNNDKENVCNNGSSSTVFKQTETNNTDDSDPNVCNTESVSATVFKQTEMNNTDDSDPNMCNTESVSATVFKQNETKCEEKSDVGYKMNECAIVDVSNSLKTETDTQADNLVVKSSIDHADDTMPVKTQNDLCTKSGCLDSIGSETEHVFISSKNGDLDSVGNKTDLVIQAKNFELDLIGNKTKKHMVIPTKNSDLDSVGSKTKEPLEIQTKKGDLNSIENETEHVVISTKCQYEDCAILPESMDEENKKDCNDLTLSSSKLIKSMDMSEAGHTEAEHDCSGLDTDDPPHLMPTLVISSRRRSSEYSSDEGSFGSPPPLLSPKDVDDEEFTERNGETMEVPMKEVELKEVDASMKEVELNKKVDAPMKEVELNKEVDAPMKEVELNRDSGVFSPIESAHFTETRNDATASLSENQSVSNGNNRETDVDSGVMHNKRTSDIPDSCTHWCVERKSSTNEVNKCEEVVSGDDKPSTNQTVDSEHSTECNRSVSLTINDSIIENKDTTVTKNDTFTTVSKNAYPTTSTPAEATITTTTTFTPAETTLTTTTMHTNTASSTTSTSSIAVKDDTVINKINDLPDSKQTARCTCQINMPHSNPITKIKSKKFRAINLEKIVEKMKCVESVTELKGLDAMCDGNLYSREDQKTPDNKLTLLNENIRIHLQKDSSFSLEHKQNNLLFPDPKELITETLSINVKEHGINECTCICEQTISGQKELTLVSKQITTEREKIASELKKVATEPEAGIKGCNTIESVSVIDESVKMLMMSMVSQCEEADTNDGLTVMSKTDPSTSQYEKTLETFTHSHIEDGEMKSQTSEVSEKSKLNICIQTFDKHSSLSENHCLKQNAYSDGMLDKDNSNSYGSYVKTDQDLPATLCSSEITSTVSQRVTKLCSNPFSSSESSIIHNGSSVEKISQIPRSFKSSEDKTRVLSSLPESSVIHKESSQDKTGELSSYESSIHKGSMTRSFESPIICKDLTVEKTDDSCFTDKQESISSADDKKEKIQTVFTTLERNKSHNESKSSASSNITSRDVFIETHNGVSYQYKKLHNPSDTEQVKHSLDHCLESNNTSISTDKHSNLFSSNGTLLGESNRGKDGVECNTKAMENVCCNHCSLAMLQKNSSANTVESHTDTASNAVQSIQCRDVVKRSESEYKPVRDAEEMSRTVDETTKLVKGNDFVGNTKEIFKVRETLSEDVTGNDLTENDEVVSKSLSEAVFKHMKDKNFTQNDEEKSKLGRMRIPSEHFNLLWNLHLKQHGSASSTADVVNENSMNHLSVTSPPSMFRHFIQPIEDPLKNYEHVMFGKQGKIVCVCAICRKQFLSVDVLLRHHWKKHPSIDFRFIEVEQGSDADLLFFPWPCNFGLLASALPIAEDYRNLNTYRCTRCSGKFKNINRLHVHIINCDPNNVPVIPNSKKKRIQKKIKGNIDLKEKESPQNYTKLDSVLDVRRRDRKVGNKGFTGCRKRRMMRNVETVLKVRKKRNYELLYNPHNHVRRREMTSLLETHQCSGCKAKFQTLHLLERHAAKCSNKETLQNLKPVQNKFIDEVTQKRRHICHYCSKHFIYLKSLDNHYRAFCSVRKEKMRNGLLMEDDLDREKQVRKQLEGLEQSKIDLELDKTVGNKRKGGWPKGMKRKKGHKKRTWTIVKRRKPSDASGDLLSSPLWNVDLYQDCSEVLVNEEEKMPQQNDDDDDKKKVASNVDDLQTPEKKNSKKRSSSNKKNSSLKKGKSTGKKVPSVADKVMSRSPGATRKLFTNSQDLSSELVIKAKSKRSVINKTQKMRSKPVRKVKRTENILTSDLFDIRDKKRRGNKSLMKNRRTRKMVEDEDVHVVIPSDNSSDSTTKPSTSATGKKYSPNNDATSVESKQNIISKISPKNKTYSELSVLKKTRRRKICKKISDQFHSAKTILKRSKLSQDGSQKTIASFVKNETISIKPLNKTFGKKSRVTKSIRNKKIPFNATEITDTSASSCSELPIVIGKDRNSPIIEIVKVDVKKELVVRKGKKKASAVPSQKPPLVIKSISRKKIPSENKSKRKSPKLKVDALMTAGETLSKSSKNSNMSEFVLPKSKNTGQETNPSVSSDAKLMTGKNSNTSRKTVVRSKLSPCSNTRTTSGKTKEKSSPKIHPVTAAKTSQSYTDTLVEKTKSKTIPKRSPKNTVTSSKCSISETIDEVAAQWQVKPVAKVASAPKYKAIKRLFQDASSISSANVGIDTVFKKQKPSSTSKKAMVQSKCVVETELKPKSPRKISPFRASKMKNISV